MKSSKERALQWYRRGLLRGFKEACDAVVEGKLEFKENTLYCPPKVVISVRIQFKGTSGMEEKKYTFTAEELGFDKDA